MKQLIKYNLEIMTVLLFSLCGYGLFVWNDISLTRKAVIGFIVLLVLHEWEESRFPGGFYRIFFSKCKIDESVSEERMHLPVAIYISILLPTVYFFDYVNAFLIVLIVLSLFEGIIHTVGIWVHQLSRPYSPGMMTAWLMFGYALIVVKEVRGFSAGEWLSGIALFFISFMLMEKSFLKSVGLTMTDFRNSMKDYMLTRLTK